MLLLLVCIGRSMQPVEADPERGQDLVLAYLGYGAQ
jgi:hypothetical protein